MNIAVIGGGINGLMTAWALLSSGNSVTLFERNQLMRETSSASTKLLHGGLRYLEHGAFRLVKEALHERSWWLNFAPDLCKPQEILYPIYKNSRRSKLMVGLGVYLYDFLAGKSSLGRSKWLNSAEVLLKFKDLKSENLLGAWSFYDAIMDDFELGIRVAENAVSQGLKIRENSHVERIYQDGSLIVNGEKESFDLIINATGPWASKLLEKSNIPSSYKLDHIKGSHLVINKKNSVGLILEYPGEARIFFVLPYKGMTLVGTTEVRQDTPNKEDITQIEIDYLIDGYESYIKSTNTKKTIVEVFSGVRPLIKSSSNPSNATREYAFELSANTLSIFGGKWTTARALGLNVAKVVQNKWRN